MDDVQYQVIQTNETKSDSARGFAQYKYIEACWRTKRQRKILRCRFGLQQASMYSYCTNARALSDFFFKFQVKALSHGQKIKR